jgi:hypothetical protein
MINKSNTSLHIILSCEIRKPEAVRHEWEISNAGQVKTGFCRNRSMQTGSSETLIGWKSGKNHFWREHGYGLTCSVTIYYLCGNQRRQLTFINFKLLYLEQI